MTSTRAVVSVLLAAALVHPSPSAADVFSNPFASFESRCEALPPAQFEVVAIPVHYTEDDSISLRALTRMNDTGTDRHRTIGLTKGQLAYESTMESKGVQDRRGGVCSRPSVKVILSVTPMTVYVAKEFAGDPCRRASIMEHEMKHVAVYRDYLAEVAARMKEDLPRAMGNDVVYARNAAAAQSAVKQRLQGFMQGFMKERYAELRARQAAVDTPEEYARLGNACGALPAGS